MQWTEVTSVHVFWWFYVVNSWCLYPYYVFVVLCVSYLVWVAVWASIWGGSAGQTGFGNDPFQAIPDAWFCDLN